MTRKQSRLAMLALFMLGLSTATALALSAMSDNIVFFRSPSDLAASPVTDDRAFRLGGLVEPGSVVREGVSLRFRVTDGRNTVPVTYVGIVPDLFHEGRGVVAEGRLSKDGVFAADEVLAKHDENYMPPEVQKALERAGHPVHATSTLEPRK